MRQRNLRVAIFLGLSPLLGPFLFAQRTDRPLTNGDVINMVRSKLPESVIVGAIQAHPGNFDTSTSGLITLHKAGVTENEMNAMVAASGKAVPGASGPRAADASISSTPAAVGAPATSSKSRMPKVYLQQGSAMQELPLEKTQLAETKTKPSSMKSLAGDSVVTQAMTTGVSTATYSAASHISSGIGGSSVQEAGGIFSGIMSHRKPTVTYVWGVPGPASGNVFQTVSPTFTVDFSRVPTVTADDYEPVIVKLTPAQNTCRIVGASEGKEDARSSPAADWQIYSKFLEERVAVKSEKIGAGKYKISPATELLSGEYAVVLRPISRSKKFSGGDVARAQGDGLMFDALWTFKIADSAE